MHKQALRLALSVLILGCVSFLVSPANSNPRPLRKSEVLALVAGRSLSENTVAVIQSRGLSFAPDEIYNSLLETAGADVSVLAALKTAKVRPEGKSDSANDSTLLQHLGAAGKMIQAKQLDDAVNELTAAVTSDFGKTEAGFVIGKILIDQGRTEEAGRVYLGIQGQDPDFPEVHTRLSFVYFEAGDAQQALKEAKAALVENPNNPVAHLNAGLALRQLHNFDAAQLEFEASIRSKPDYALGYNGLGNLLEDLKDFDGAIAQYRKALTLTDDIEIRYNLGIALIHRDPAAAIAELRKVTELAPNWPICHECLGNALQQTGLYPDAAKEYHLAAQLDTTSPGPHTGLGLIFEAQKKYDQALAEYRIAEDLGAGRSYSDIGRVLLTKKEYSAAITELQRAEEADPTDWASHALRGEALELYGDRDQAIAEYKEALSTAPKSLQPRLDLALALEKKGDWLAALDHYHQAVLDEPAHQEFVSYLDYRPQQKYESAQKRFQQHLADLRSAGKAAEAAALEAGLRNRNSTASLDERFHDAMQATSKAASEKRFDDAETSAKQAIAIAERIQPQDGRLPEAVSALGNVYGGRLDFPKAEDAFQRQLVLCEKLYGTKSPMIIPAIRNLAAVAAQRNDLPAAEAFFSRALDLNQTAYGPESLAVAQTLGGLASIYLLEGDFAKSESSLLRALHIFENAYGEESLEVSIPLTNLCYVYDQGGKVDKSAPCHARLVAIAEKQYGANSPYLIPELTAEAVALRQLGRADEAARVEQRTQAIQSAQANPQ